jgi:hypothetical protein
MEDYFPFSGVGKEPFTHLSDSPGAPSGFQPRGRLLVLPPPCPPNPVDAYLSRLAPSSSRTMRKLLHRIATLICPHLNISTVYWHLLRYPDTLEIRHRLTETYAPATCRLALAALRGLLREVWRLGQLSHEEYERAIDLPAVRGTGLVATSPAGSCNFGDPIRGGSATCGARCAFLGRRWRRSAQRLRQRTAVSAGLSATGGRRVSVALDRGSWQGGRSTLCQDPPIRNVHP